MNEHLMRALLYAALFFESSSDEVCDSYLAVKQLEDISATLQEMSRADQEEFRSFAYREAERHPDPVAGREIRELVDGLLTGDEEEQS